LSDFAAFGPWLLPLPLSLSAEAGDTSAAHRMDKKATETLRMVISPVMSLLLTIERHRCRRLGIRAGRWRTRLSGVSGKRQEPPTVPPSV
jgi:hypothetical protein